MNGRKTDEMMKQAARPSETVKHGAKNACVIGAGFGGLALAIRLQSAGIATTVIEARDKPGGHAYFWEEDGFTFDAGPSALTDPDCLKELWSLSGGDMAEDVELMRVVPNYRLNWPDGTNFDFANDDTSLSAEIAKLDPDDIAGYAEYLEYAKGAFDEVFLKLGTGSTRDFKGTMKAASTLVKKQAWRSVHATVSSFVKNDKLREALSFQSVLVGGNPMTTSAIHASNHRLEREQGVWWTRGGTNRLIAGMVRQFERLGGTIRLGDPAVQIHTFGSRVSEVETKSGWKKRFDAVASNADIMHTYRDLLKGTKRSQDRTKSLSKNSLSPGMFVVHFGLEGTWPGIPHHMMLFGPRFEDLLDDIFEQGVLPRDFMIYLHHPTVTDPSLAPKGKSIFYAAVPVAHLGKLAVDWEQLAPTLEKRILDEIGRRLIPDIHDRIVTKFNYTPKHAARDMNAHLGSAFTVEPTLKQSAYLNSRNRDEAIENFYLVGASTHPGTGIPGVLTSAKTTASLMLEDLGVKK